jgi:hypothetical protein
MDDDDAAFIKEALRLHAMINNGPLYCISCKRRQSYATCKTCLKPVCAICAWTKDNSYKGDDSFRTEVCRGCR